MRSTKNLTVRVFTAMAAVLLFGAGVAAAESVIASDEPLIDCDDAAFADEDECVLDDEAADGDLTDETATDEVATDDEIDDATGDDEGDGTEDSTDSIDCDDPAFSGEDECLVDDEVTDDEEGEGPPEDTHGARVSAAAKDRSNDERCGNHGAWVSSVARGLDDCVPAHDDSDDSADEGDDTEVAVTSANGRGSRPDHAGRPEHAGPPAGVGNGNGNGRGNGRP